MERVKKFVRNWCPPELRRIINKIRGVRSSVNTYEGTFFSYNECASACQNTFDYMDVEHDDLEAQRFLKKLSGDPLNDPMPCRESAFVTIFSLIPANVSVGVLDFGGASNPIYSKIPFSRRDRLECYILDRHDIVKKINQLMKHANVNVVDDLDEVFLNSDVNIVYFGSSIQYLHDDTVVRRVFELKADFVIIADSVFSDKNDLWVQQVNMYPLVFPNRWWSIEKLTAFGTSNGYTQPTILKTSTNHIHDELEMIPYRTLIFSRV